jgi:hypothetical protein
MPPLLDQSEAFARAPELFELFGRGGAWASSRLEKALQNPETAGLALYGLSRASGAAARVRLEKALAEPRLRASALRALALRHARLGDDSAALVQLLPRSFAATEPSERAAAAFAEAVLDPAAIVRRLRSNDAVVVLAVARLAVSGAAARAAVERLRGERDVLVRTALCAGLADPDAAALVPTSLLLELTHEAGPGSLLAAAALSARKDADLLPLIRELLSSGDPWLRAHALLGLSRAQAPDALGMIENAYRFEPDASVRRAAIVALSQRPEPVRARTLLLAASLDASRAVREAAHLALSGHGLGAGVAGPETAWLELSKNPGLEATQVPAALVRVGAGLALPVIADPDGVVALSSVDPAPLEVRLALLAQPVFGRGASR